MTTLGAGTAATPEEKRPAGTQLKKNRRTVQLAELSEVVVPPDPPPPVVIIPESRHTGRSPLPTSRDDWLRLAERAVGDWAATLRAALLLLLAFAGLILSIGIAFGLESAAAASAVGLLVFLAGRRRGGSASD